MNAAPDPRATVADDEFSRIVASELADLEVPARARVATVLRVALVAFVAFMVLGNVAVLVASQIARHAGGDQALDVPGVHNVRIVDDRVLRGAAPSDDGLRALAARGVTTVVDLRAEADLRVNERLLRDLGVERIHLPVRDGQLPSEAQIAQFVAAVAESRGITFVHCGAGVGRTGAMVAAYKVRTGAATGRGAVWANLAVGPPSWEQLSYAAGLSAGGYDRPSPVVVGASRLLDAPRRLWSRYGL